MAQTGDGYDAARQLREVGDRLSEMLDTAVDDRDLSPAQVRLLLQEMATAMEELRVAEEELTVQAEQLTASNLAVDAERERYAQLFEFAPDAYLETDGHGKIIEANGAAQRLLGVPVRFMAGKLVQTFVATADVRSVRSALAALGEGAEPVSLEVELAPRDLPPVTVEIRLVSQWDPAAGATGERRVRWLIRDITERLKLEREVRRLHADVELLDALAEVNRLVAGAENPVDPMLERLVRLAVQASGGAEAGVSVLDKRGRMTARAVSSPAAQELCDHQLTEGGPAALVLDDKRPRVDRTRDLAQWPDLVAVMARPGIEWIVSHPILPPDGGEVGVFNLYGRGPLADVERSIELLADHAAGIIANGLLYSSATELAQQLAEALESRGVIEQAKGVLMAWQGCDADAAFDILRRVSQRENRKLRVIAEEIVQKGMKTGSQRR